MPATTPELVVVDGAPGLEKALAALWPDVAVQRCTVHKHRNLLAHAPERLHEEISNDYRDMIYAATRGEVETWRKAFIANGASNAAPSPTAWRKPATSCSHSRGSRRTNGNRSEPRMRSTSSFCASVLFMGSASDLGAKRGVSAASAARRPIRSLPV